MTPRTRRTLRTLAVIGLCTILAVVLNGCSYPGETNICGTNGAGCAAPDGPIKNSYVGGQWYLDWFSSIVIQFLANIASQAVQLSVNLFWTIYSHLGSTNFANGSADPQMQKRLDAVNQAEQIVRLAALVCVPPLFVWNTFRGQMLGAVIDELRESWLRTIGVFFGAIMLIAFLPQAMTFFFGLSSDLFAAIAGSPADFNAVAQNVYIGAAQINDSIKNPGIMFIVFLVLVLMSLVWILLGIAFFVRTVEVYLLFVIGPLAILAGLSHDLEGWFKRWLMNVAGLFVAPLLVAAAFRLVITFGDMTVLSHGPTTDKYSNFDAYLLQILYVTAFLGVATYLMFFIAGKTGQVALGLAKSALSGLVAGAAAGSVIARRNGAEAEAESKTPPDSKVRVSEPQPPQIGGGGRSNGAGLLPPTGGEQPGQLGMDMRGLRESIYGLNAPASLPQLPPGRPPLWGTPTGGGDGGAPTGSGNGGDSPPPSGGAGVYGGQYTELPGDGAVAMPIPIIRASIPIPRRAVDPFGAPV